MHRMAIGAVIVVTLLSSTSNDASGLSFFCPELGCPAPPSPPHAPVAVEFDFENGLQGWAVSGSVTRVQSQVLGGQWAVLGDGLAEGGARITIELDLSHIAFIRLERLFLGEFEHLVPLQMFAILRDRDTAFVRFPQVFFSQSNPTEIFFDVSDVSGTRELSLDWGASFVCARVSCLGVRRDSFLALIDNIALLEVSGSPAVPEPATLVLLGIGLALLALLVGRSDARSGRSVSPGNSA